MSSFFFFFFKQKTAYEMRISDWSSDVCSSDLEEAERKFRLAEQQRDEKLKKIQAELAHPPRPPHLAVEPVQLREHRRDPRRALFREQIGRASCRERVCQYV